MCYHFFHLPISGPRIVTLRVASLIDIPARYHVVPTQEVAIIRMVEEKGERELASVRWGLVPSWVRHPEEVSPQLANARSETITSKASFKKSFEQRRCLILADGFFEWKRNLTSKQPYCIRPESKELITFAGIWERWQKADRIIESCSIITTASNAEFAMLHDRMPVMLPAQHHDQWLDTAESRTDRLVKLLQTPAPDLNIYPVRPLRGRKASDPKLIEPIEALPIQRSLFD